MKTTIDKNESELDKMKREALEWIERYGKTAPSFISVAVNAFSQTLPESKELTDLKQYVTNLLYFAHSVSSDDFDAWVEEQTNNLDQYFQSHPEAREMPSDEQVYKVINGEVPHTISEESEVIFCFNEKERRAAELFYKWFKYQIK